MKVCPQCREEYIEQMERCHHCQINLVSEIEAQRIKPKQEILSTKELLEEELVPLSEGVLSQCRELEKALKAEKISCAVYPANLNCGDSGANLGASCAMKYQVLVRPQDVPACKDALEGKFLRDLEKEGQGNFVKEAVDLGQNEVLCPACNEKGVLAKGECSFCGLFLGEIEA